jgi:hypothetical protein
LNSHAITCYSDGCNAEVRNNILLAPANGGISPINRGSGFATSDNLCESGSTCGGGSVSGTASTVFQSTSATSATFLMPKGSALGSGLLQTGISTDYLGSLRLTIGVGGTDVGAILADGAPSGAVPAPPASLAAQ